MVRRVFSHCRANDYEEPINRDKASLEPQRIRQPSLSRCSRERNRRRPRSPLEQFREIPTALDGEATKETTDVAVRFAESELFQHWRGRYNEGVTGGLYPNVLPGRLCLSDE